MSLMVTGIGVLGVVALLPLAFVRAVQATNLTNGTILRYNAESMLTVNQRLLLRWQANQQYQVGDIVLSPGRHPREWGFSARPPASRAIMSRPGILRLEERRRRTPRRPTLRFGRRKATRH